MNGHIPVLLDEMMEYLLTNKDGCYLDGTFGAGGYSSAILRTLPNSHVIAIDRDSTVQRFVDELKKKYSNRFTFFNKKFSDLNELLNTNDIKLDGAVFDLGISSMQIDNAERGFSFKQDADLDMRMGLNEYSAFDIVNKACRKELEHILLNYGEEYKFKQITEKIIEYRQHTPIKTTIELSNIVKSVYKTRKKINPATKTFQALRIVVNDELNEIQSMLDVVTSHLKVKGRLVIVSFHSLEDRIIKNYFRCCDKNFFNVLTKKPKTVKQDELGLNKRARSAKLRAIERVG